MPSLGYGVAIYAHLLSSLDPHAFPHIISHLLEVNSIVQLPMAVWTDCHRIVYGITSPVC